MLNRKSDWIVTEVFLAGKENSSGKDSHEKTRKEKREDKKPLLAGYPLAEVQMYIILYNKYHS